MLDAHAPSHLMHTLCIPHLYHDHAGDNSQLAPSKRLFMIG